MGYTIVLQGVGSYTFDGAAHVQPTVDISWDYEYNRNLVPPVISAELEIWDLRNFVFVDSTPGNVTTDMESLAAILRNKIPQFASATLNYNNVPVRVLGSAFHQIMIRGMKMHGGPGSLANHWMGDLVIVGRKLLGDNSSIVRLDQKLTTKANPEGLITQVYSGEIEVLPNTNLATTIAGIVPAALGGNYILEDNGPSGPFSMKIENEPTNTIASFTQTQRQIGVILPSGATSYRQSSGYRDTPEGRMTTTSAQAGGTTIALALSAAQSVKPKSGLALVAQMQDLDTLKVSTEYVQRGPVPRYAAAYGQGTLVKYEREVEVSGGGQGRTFEPISGFRPFEFLDPIEEVTIVERVIVTAVKVGSPSDIPIPKPLLDVKYMIPSLCSEYSPSRGDVGETRDADVWIRRIVRGYKVSDPAVVDFTEMFNALAQAPGWNTDTDYRQRTAGT